MKKALGGLLLVAYSIAFGLFTYRLVGFQKDVAWWYLPGPIVLVFLAFLCFGRTTKLGAAITLALAAGSIAVPVLLLERRERAAASAAREPAQPAAQSIPSPSAEARPADANGRLPALRAELASAVADARWSEASTTLARIREIAPEDPAIYAAEDRVRRGLAGAEESETEEQRRERVATAVVLARGVTSEPSRCGSAVWVGRAWKGLRRARPGDPEWSDAVQLASGLERCRVDLIGSLRQQEAFGRAEAQVLASKEFCRRFLASHGVALEPSIGGSSGRELTLTWPLLDATVVRQWSGGTEAEAARSALLSELAGLGFDKLIWSDGAGGRWELALRSQAESAVLDRRLAELGLDRPFALSGSEAASSPPAGQ